MQIAREPIFRSTLRSFFATLAIIIGIGFGCIVVAIAATAFTNTISFPSLSQATLAPNAQDLILAKPSNTPVILRINLHGVVGLDGLSSSKINDLLIDSRNQFMDGKLIKAIFLHINTPGGMATDSQVIYQKIKDYKNRYQVPVYAYVEGLCASGGMYIASAADKIYSTSSSTIGSVGVRMGPIFNFCDGLDKLGIKALTLTAGKNKDTLNPFRPWTETEGKEMQELINQNYVQFLAAVTEGRPRLSKEKLVAEYGAQVFLGPEAEKLGYVDNGDATYGQALQDLVRACNIDGDNYQVVQLSSPTPLFSSIQNKLKAKENFLEEMHPLFAKEFRGRALFLYVP